MLSIMAAGTLYLGTSGFAYAEWKGVFYPAGLKDREMLGFYASRLSSVEINYTFRRYPSEKTLIGWRAQAPDGFLVTLKANQQITHWRRLADADEPVSRFLEAARPLGDRLGAILFQCPPDLPYDRSLIEAFVGYLPPGFRYAFEFRHPSWVEAMDLLAGQRAAWCVAETEEQPVPPDEELPAGPFVYLRLRKEAYAEDELRGWAERIAGVLDGGRDVFCYFKHENKEAGPAFAERMGELLAQAGGNLSP